jgi:adenylosuccinate synthase
MSNSVTVVILSGPVASGKSSVAASLVSTHGFRRIGSSDYLKRKAANGDKSSRTELQELGDYLDLTSDFSWVVNDVVAPAIEREPSVRRWLFDSVRKHRQVEHFRGAFRSAVFHVHLQASEELLRERYEKRRIAAGAPVTYDQAVAHPNEIAARLLFDVADLVIDVDRLSGEETAARISKQLRERSHASDSPD